MRRGAKPAKTKVEAKPPIAPKSPKNDGARIRDLEKLLAEALKREAEASKREEEALRQLQTRDRELVEARERQTASSEILRVIASSPTDLQPVLEAVARNAARLCQAQDVAITRAEEDGLTILYSLGPDVTMRGRKLPYLRTATTLAIREVRTVHVPDLLADPDIELRPEFQRFGWRTGLAVPLVREGVALGTITARRAEVRPFSDQEIKLLETFADQAVIAIENVRLFKELEDKNRALTQAHAHVSEALEQQTATAEILRVISQSQTDVQPVFEAIADSALRLCDAKQGVVFLFDGELIHLGAVVGADEAATEVVRSSFPQPPGRVSATTRAILTLRPVVIPDVLDDAEYRLTEVVRAADFRSAMSVPMLRAERPIGAITVTRAEPGPFPDRQLALLQTFADQAVIAIENARLFKELQARTLELTRSVNQLTALGEVGQAVSSSLDLETVLNTIVSRAVQLSAANGGLVYEYNEAKQEFDLISGSYNLDEEIGEVLRVAPIRLGEGVTGKAGALRAPVQVPDILDEQMYDVARTRAVAERLGYRAVLAVPLLCEERILGVLLVWRREPGDFAPEIVGLLMTFATQSALAIQNARLFLEIADKSRQLEAASRHKSEFLANMSHELRTPLNAIIGFSEVLSERMFGELNEKQVEYLKDIYDSGQHLLSLINDILDLSKIEAGRMELEQADFDLPSAIDNALILVRERASRRGITLGHSVDERLGRIRGDERKVKQVLLNLLSNALKFTPEGGRIDVSARMNDGVAEVSVADTGVGIAPEDQEAVFEEFRQVGTADKKVEGTGLGLALSRKFIELHGGRIWVESEVGKGSAFRFTLPVRCEESADPATVN